MFNNTTSVMLITVISKGCDHLALYAYSVELEFWSYELLQFFDVV